MKFTLSWLKEHLETNSSLDEITNNLTEIGLEVEDIINPEKDLEDFIKLSKTQKLSDNSWSIDIEKINTQTLDLSVQNPNIVEEIDERTPEQIISEIQKLDQQNLDILKKIKNLL